MTLVDTATGDPVAATDEREHGMYGFDSVHLNVEDGRVRAGLNLWKETTRRYRERHREPPDLFS